MSKLTGKYLVNTGLVTPRQAKYNMITKLKAINKESNKSYTAKRMNRPSKLAKSELGGVKINSLLSRAVTLRS